MFYTYAHYTADTNEIFYIGKGTGKRFNQKANRNRWWHNKVNKHGFTSKILAHWKTEKEALDHEEFFIKCFRDLGKKLVNLAVGGRCNSGWQHSDETRAQMSKVHKGRPRSDYERKRLSESLKGLTKSQQHKDALSKAKTGSKVPLTWKPVFCITNNTLYSSLTEAAEKTGRDPSHIVKCCKGKIKQIKGMEFKYG